ncbi:hypothetical protein LS482_19615 [Sinomicrobium kalidii]|uniref:hypothetical protein n=1 Tax=Sinomicrobium kalidii TaxID=2900738 RepID=UPI001E461EEB|nr:hypothetical protein [Sinomicrobium kalidii]UGU15874.1 hypothetical protein LS482_19615 [Sinomicrobium kalidii]
MIKRIYTTGLLGIFTLIAFSCSGSDNDSSDPADNTGKPDNNSTDTTVLDDSRNLGVNFNEQLDYIDNDQLIALRTEWVRGFLNFFRYYENPSLIDTDPKITKYLGLHTYGFSTVLNIKWLFRDRDYPAAGSQEMDDQMDILRTILDKVWDKTNIIVVGNEPFIETDIEDLNTSMYNYYVEAANVVKAYADEHGSRPIFFGSFDNMYQARRQNLQVLNDLLSFSASTPWIAGVDLHIHHADTRQMTDALDFVSVRIRDDQKILVTEFSLMKHFRNNLDGTIPSRFAADYGFSETLQNYEYIDYALKNQVTKGQWTDFLRQSPWFENRKHYLSNSFYNVFSSYDKFFLANYAFRQAYPPNKDFTVNNDPWQLNGLYANRTVETDPQTGRYQFNYAWPESFIAIQNDTNP